MPKQTRKKAEQAVLEPEIRLPEVRVVPFKDNRTLQVMHYEVMLMATTETGVYSMIGPAVRGMFDSEEEALAAWQRGKPKEFKHAHLWKGQEKYIVEQGLYRY